MLYKTGLEPVECPLCGEQFDHHEDIAFLERNDNCGCEETARAGEAFDMRFHCEDYLSE